MIRDLVVEAGGFDGVDGVTVTEFLMPDTVRLVQWPVITTVLDMPLTLTMLSLQAIVRFTLTPETLRLAPAGGRVVAGCAVGVGTARETDGVGERTTKLPWESRCALNAAMPPTRTSTPTTTTAARIHHALLPEDDRGDGPPNGPP